MSVAADAVAARARSESETIALLFAGALLLWSLCYGLVLLWNGVPDALGLAQPFGAVAVHVLFWIYAGRLHGRRRTTWLLLIVAAAGAQAFVFLGHVLPWAQIDLRVATTAPWLVRAFEWVAGNAGVLVALSLPSFLVLDLWVAHRRGGEVAGWRRAVGPLLLLVLLGYVALAAAVPRCDEPDAFASVAELRAAVECGATRGTFGAAPSGVTAFPTPARIVPKWNVLPFYAVLRAVPGKEAGVVAFLAVLLAPALAAWFGAERLRAGRTGRLWLAACLLALAAVAALGYLGAQPAEEPYLLASRVAALYVATFFLLPFVLHRLR